MAEKAIAKTRSKSSGKDVLAMSLVDITIQKKELEKEEKTLKAELMKVMEIGDKLEAKGHVVSRIKTETPIVSVEAAKNVIGNKDILEVVKVSITELKKFMGENEIREIATDFTVKDYVSVKEK